MLTYAISGLKGKTPVVTNRSKRFSINMVSTVSNNGKLRFMLYKETLKTDVFIEFLRRLVKYSKKNTSSSLPRIMYPPSHSGGVLAEEVARRAHEVVQVGVPGY